MTPTAEAAEVVQSPLPPLREAGPNTVPELQAYASKVAEAHDLPIKRFLAVITCESQWDTTAEGDHHTSFGLAQLHNPRTDWGITPEEAEDPTTALPLMAKAWEEGKAGKWSCYRLLYGSRDP